MDPEVAIEKLQQALVAWGPNLVGALVILILGYLAAKFVTGILRRSLKRANVDDTLVKFSSSIANIALMTMVVIAVLERLGVNTTSFAAVLAAAGLAIGLAFQDTLANFAAGVLVMIFRPFAVDDYVEAGGVSGTVEEVQIFTTVLRTPDNKRVIVGNAAILGDAITNYSANDQRRVDMVFGIGYSDRIDEARRILEGILAADARVLEDPEPVVAVLELADSSVNFAVRPWVPTPDYWSVYFDITEKVKLAFDDAGVSIPFPQQDVHLHSVADVA